MLRANYLPTPPHPTAHFGAETPSTGPQPVVVMQTTGTPISFLLTVSVGIAIGYVIGRKA